MHRPLPKKTMKRWEHTRDVRFLTFSCYRKLPLLRHPKIKDLFARELANHTKPEDVRLIAWVAMHDHIHLILQPTGDETVTRFLAKLKRDVSRQVIRRWR